MRIEGMEEADVLRLPKAFAGTPWERSQAVFRSMLEGHAEGRRDVRVVFEGDVPIGFGSVLWRSRYPPFAEDGIAEIHDVVVHPRWRKRGAATALLDLLEGRVVEVADRVGVGVGLHAGFGAAQRLYVKRGFVPDGRGAHRDYEQITEGQNVRFDDDVTLWLVKIL